MGVRHKTVVPQSYGFLNGTPYFLWHFWISRQILKAVYVNCLMPKMYHFRVISENSKLLTAAGSHGNQSHILTTANFGMGLLGLQEDLMSYMLMYLNFKKSFSQPSKYASEVE
ncbi:hypothetical protein ABEB36_015723 [Hypothenemus hampei]|uniref:Uncharacterized protein n=1 Tax=Hypothenemus hampei TaxID=57062 RepID=A0ABD1E0T0_HYPHA